MRREMGAFYLVFGPMELSAGLGDTTELSAAVLYTTRSRTLHPWRGLRDVRHFVRLLRYLAPAPEGIELSQSSVTPTRMLGGHDAQLPQRATNEHNGVVLRGIQPGPTLRDHGEGKVQRFGLWIACHA